MITIEFTTENAAFGDNDQDMLLESACVLRKVVKSLVRQIRIQSANDCTLTKLIEPIRDTNGNPIGTLTYTKDLFPNK